jgi:GUN4-like/NACHT domain
LALTYGRDKAPTLPKLVPMLLLLRKYRADLTQESPLSLPDLIMQKHVPGLPLLDGKELKLPATWAETTLKAGKALVMVDGFDEVPTAQRPLVTRWLNAQMRRYSKSTFILTSRPKAHQEQDPAETLDLETIVWVKDFQEAQWQTFVRQWYWCQEYYHHGKEDTPDVRQEAERSAEELLAQIADRQELKDLAKNPLLLNMMATFHRRFPSVELPRRSVELYQEMCLLQLRDRPGARGLEKVLGHEEALVILQMLALEMMQRHEERIGQGEILQRLGGYLAARSETVTALALLKYIEQVSELLVQREPEEFEFSHLSFQEYLAAREILRLQRTDLLYDQFGESWWKATILMVAAQMNPSGLVREMLARDAEELAFGVCRDTTKRLDAGLIEQVQTARYARLEALLAAQKWKEADLHTYRLMITAVGKEWGAGFTRQELLNFPCDVLLKIDGLWVQHSQGRFGFSVQKEIYVRCGGKLDGNDPSWEVFEKFADEVGWRINGEWPERYADVADQASLSGGAGIFPGVVGVGWVAVVSLLSHRDL